MSQISLRNILPMTLTAAAVAILSLSPLLAAEPPAINPFGPVEGADAGSDKSKPPRDDAVEGCVELSDGAIRPGWIYLTRDKRLKLYDDQARRQREIPLQAVAKIECRVKREWMEREWKFKETTSDEKIYTGRTYPAREYLHTITLKDGRTVAGPLAAIVYVQSIGKPEAERFLLNKRNKGDLGQDLKSLVYVKRIRFGKEAMQSGEKKQAEKK